MKRMSLLLVALAALGGALFAAAQTTSIIPAPTSAPVTPTINVTTKAMEERSASVPPHQKSQAQASMEAQARKVDKGAAKAGETKMATRLAAEFGMTTEALLTERAKYKTGWGEMVIAHTLAASGDGDVTADQLYGLRQQGMGWGNIAAGLGLSLPQAVSAVNAESQVALGLAKADGKVKRISVLS